MSAAAPASGGSAMARRMWQALETLHMTVYFAPEPRDAYRRAGLRGGWMGYFASRSAAMGPVPAEVVAATFYNFHPRMVHRAIPDAWGFAPPEAVLAARLEGADGQRAAHGRTGQPCRRAEVEVGDRAAVQLEPVLVEGRGHCRAPELAQEHRVARDRSGAEPRRQGQGITRHIQRRRILYLQIVVDPVEAHGVPVLSGHPRRTVRQARGIAVAGGVRRGAPTAFVEAPSADQSGGRLSQRVCRRERLRRARHRDGQVL